MNQRLASRHVVLLGIGHTNAHIVRMWQMHAPPDTDLTCLSNHSFATYSGMLPALLAGQVEPPEMEINLPALCGAAGARLITDPVIGIDHSSRKIQFESRPSVPFDVLSIGIGSVASMEGVENSSDTLVSIKPMQTFLPRLSAALSIAEQRRPQGELSITVVGSGVAGIEITSCLPNFLNRHSSREFRLTVVTRSDVILPEVKPRTRELVADVWRQRDVRVITGTGVQRVDSGSVHLEDGQTIETDVVLWATGAAPPPLLSKLGLDLDERGFLATNHHLESTNLSNVFAVGDTGTIVDENLPKAGVYAVRQGPVLWDNIRAALDGRPLVRYDPQTNFLKLINLGDGRAVGQWKGFSFRGRWVMALKDWIDSRFMEKFTVQPMDSNGGDPMEEMQCRGCGCKLGADSLRSALASGSDVELEDAAPIGDESDRDAMIASTDFFTAPLDDAFTVGRIAALHSASDIVASGASVTSALANLVVPEGDARTQQRIVADLLAGARREFSVWDASIVGGHTIVGPRLEIGFTVIGRRIGSRLLRKSKLRVGDQLLLTKPIGIGVLLAAHMRHQCPARAMDRLMEVMLEPQHEVARIGIELGVEAATDITGFGLIGHLIEMAESSHVTAELDIDAVPMLPSAVELAGSGIESSLLPENLAAQRKVKSDEVIRQRPEYRLLFDPQTCGGLLLGVRAADVDEFQSRMMDAGLQAPAVVGEVKEGADAGHSVVVKSTSAARR